MTKPKKKKKKRARSNPPSPAGRLGPEQWLAVRQKSGAGPMEPKPRRGTRAQHEREAVEREAIERETSGE
jgi:hypothetical protein